MCIARTIAVSPEVILMDEPCSAPDPIATARMGVRPVMNPGDGIRPFFTTDLVKQLLIIKATSP